MLGTFHLHFRYKSPSVNSVNGSLFVTVVGAKDLDVNWCNVVMEEIPDAPPANPSELSPSLVSPRALLSPRDPNARANIVTSQQYRTLEYTGTYTTGSPVWNETFSFRVPQDKVNKLVLRFTGMKGKIPIADGAVRIAGVVLDPACDFGTYFLTFCVIRYTTFSLTPCQSLNSAFGWSRPSRAKKLARFESN